jgi:hypothetical protein
MSEVRAAWSPWTQRLAETPPWSPLRLSLAIACGLGAAFVALEAGLDRFPLVLAGGHTRGDFRVACVMIALVAYLPAAYALAVSGARRALEEIAPTLRCTPAELAALRERAGCFDARALRGAGVLGVALGLSTPLATNPVPDSYAFWALPPEADVHRVLLPALGWLGGRFVYAVLAESRWLSRIGRELVQVDLLDLRLLAPLVHQGLRQALLCAGVLSLLALTLVDVDIAPGLLAVTGACLAASTALSAAALALPVRGAHQAIAAAKRAELERCTEEIRALRAGAASGERSLADLLAWRSYVAALPEWPFDAPTLLRFALYGAIPLGSWLGGALVEKLVDRLLG